MNTETKIRNAIQKKSNIEFKESDQKGKGQFGEVYLHEVESHQVAVKCFKTADEDYAIKEGNVLDKIQSIAKDCPGIFSYYGRKKLDIKIKKQKEFLNQNYEGNCLFLQACDGNLKDIPNFPKKEIFNFLSQISLSLFCLHENGCSHSDLKPDNILFNVDNTQQLQYYLADFGVSKFLTLNIDTYYQKESVKGTPYYFSPELLAIYRKSQPEGNYNPIAADIFALGLICLELLIGSSLVWELNQSYQQEAQYNQVLNKIRKELLKLQEFQSKPHDQILTLLLNMASFERKQRPSAIQICQTLMEAKVFNIDALETRNMKALIYQLINALKPLKTSIGKKPNVKQTQEESKVFTIPQNEIITIPSFSSNILKNSTYSSLILSLFDDSKIQLSRIHHQINEFNINKFHNDCDNKGSTLIIMRSNSEPNCFFGGMAVPSWQSPDNYCYGIDPADQSSWLFKIELEGKQLNLHQWECIQKDSAIVCDKNYGPFFGYQRYQLEEGEHIYIEYQIQLKGLCVKADASYSYLPSNSGSYQKQDLTGKLQDPNNLLFSLNKNISIKCPSKVIGQIINENKVKFELSECEVFTVKK